MPDLGHLYIWFVVIVAGLAGAPRLLLSRRFAELQRAKLQQKDSVLRARRMSLVTLVVVFVFAGVYVTRLGHETWVQIALIFSLLAAAEFFFQSKFPTLDALIFQNRLLGILYLGLSVGSYVMLSRS